MRFVVTGCSRGLGLELARELDQRGHAVIACVRDPASLVSWSDRVRVCALDVTDDASCKALGELIEGVDCLVHNAAIGTFGSFSDLTNDALLLEYDTNAVGPVRVTRSLLSQLRRSRGRVFFLSSDMASFGREVDEGRAYAYRMSKVALNMFAKNLAHELRSDGVAAICVHPGWLRTSMGGASATMEPRDAASKLALLFETRGMESTGSFLDVDGHAISW